MASKREIKKYIHEQCNAFAGKAYPVFLSAEGEKREKADALLHDTVELLDEYTSRVYNYPKKQKDAIGGYFANLKTDFDESVDALYDKLNSL